MIDKYKTHIEWDKIGPQTAVWCRTEEEAVAFLEEAARHGVTWHLGDKTTDYTNYETHKNKTCYVKSDDGLLYGSLDFLKKNNYKIISFHDLLVGDSVENDKPRICQVLGVEVGERFDLPAPYRHYSDCYVTADAMVYAGTQKIGSGGLCWLYEHPDSIIRKPRFTEEEVAQAKDIRHIFGREDTIRRTDNGVLCYGYIILNSSLLPSLSPGQTVKLEDITGADVEIGG